MTLNLLIQYGVVAILAGNCVWRIVKAFAPTSRVHFTRKLLGRWSPDVGPQDPGTPAVGIGKRLWIMRQQPGSDSGTRPSQGCGGCRGCSSRAESREQTQDRANGW